MKLGDVFTRLRALGSISLVPIAAALLASPTEAQTFGDRITDLTFNPDALTNQPISLENLTPSLALPKSNPYIPPMDGSCPCMRDYDANIRAYAAALDTKMPEVGFNSSKELAPKHADVPRISEHSLSRLKQQWEGLGNTLKQVGDPRLTKMWKLQGHRLSAIERRHLASLSGEDKLFFPNMGGSHGAADATVAEFFFELTTGHKVDLGRPVHELSKIDLMLMSDDAEVDLDDNFEQAVTGGGVLGPHSFHSKRTSPVPTGRISDTLTAGIDGEAETTALLRPLYDDSLSFTGVAPDIKARPGMMGMGGGPADNVDLAPILLEDKSSQRRLNVTQKQTKASASTATIPAPQDRHHRRSTNTAAHMLESQAAKSAKNKQKKQQPAQHRASSSSDTAEKKILHEKLERISRALNQLMRDDEDPKDKKEDGKKDKDKEDEKDKADKKDGAAEGEAKKEGEKGKGEEAKDAKAKEGEEKEERKDQAAAQKEAKELAEKAEKETKTKINEELSKFKGAKTPPKMKEGPHHSHSASYPPYFTTDDFRWDAALLVLVHVAQADGLAPHEKKEITMQSLIRGAPRTAIVAALHGSSASPSGKRAHSEKSMLGRAFKALKSAKNEVIYLAMMASVADGEISAIEASMLHFVAAHLDADPKTLDHVFGVVKAQMAVQDATARVLYDMAPAPRRKDALASIEKAAKGGKGGEYIAEAKKEMKKDEEEEKKEEKVAEKLKEDIKKELTDEEILDQDDTSGANEGEGEDEGVEELKKGIKKDEKKDLGKNSKKNSSKTSDSKKGSGSSSSSSKSKSESADSKKADKTSPKK